MEFNVAAGIFHPFATMCVDYSLGTKILQKTKFNTNTQKCEAVNRCLRQSLPEHTFSRNFVGRAHSTIHSINNGPAESVLQLSQNMVCSFSPGSKVVKSMKQMQENRCRHRLRKKSIKYKNKIKRCQTRKSLYALYEIQLEHTYMRKASTIMR